MPQRTNSFQRLVTMLSATLAGQAKVTESAMLQDRVTGESREIDVLVVATAASYQLRIGIEVVAWSRPADTPWVERMRAKHDNLPVDKLILVSESGFSAPAKRKAQFYGIETLTIEEANEADWPLIAKLEGTGVFEITTLCFDCAAVCRFDRDELEQLPVPTTASFSTPDGTKTIDQFVRSILEKDELRDVIRANLTGNHEHDFWMSYTEPNGLWRLDHEGRSGQITELRIGLKVLKAESPVRFACGTFRSVPFVSGTAETAASPLQFVLAKNSDGGLTGYLIDVSGVRTLSSHQRQASEA